MLVKPSSSKCATNIFKKIYYLLPGVAKLKFLLWKSDYRVAKKYLGNLGIFGIISNNFKVANHESEVK